MCIFFFKTNIFTDNKILCENHLTINISRISTCKNKKKRLLSDGILFIFVRKVSALKHL